MFGPIYIYHAGPQDAACQAVCDFFRTHHLNFTTVDLEQDARACEEVAKWSDGREQVTPVVRVGERILALFFNPSVAALSRMFEPSTVADAGGLAAQPVTVYSADWCPDCRRLEGYLDRQGKQFSKVNIETVAGAPEQVMRWSGGRRVIPTIRIGHEVMLFNPGPQIVGRLLNLEA